MAKIDYDKIPEQLRWDRAWCLSGPDEDGRFKAPYSVGPKGIFRIKTTDNTHWKDLETVIDAAELYPPCGIGFVLSEDDIYTCIDLDIKNVHNYPDKVDHKGKPVEWTSQEDIDRYHRIIEKFDSYTERSASGQGYHIWVKGNIGEGCRRDGVEVYSRERFIICTGDTVIDKDIEERQDLLDILVAEIGNAAQPKVELIDREQTEEDSVIMERARIADNAAKFIKLADEGDFSDYPSQSEADLALMSMFTFYSKSNEQCRRLFRMTKLGERAKAQKNDRHLNLMLGMIRGREAEEEKADAAAAAAGARLLACLNLNHTPIMVPPAPAPAAVVTAQVELDPEDDFEYQADMPIINFGLTAAPKEVIEEPPQVEVGLPWPPGVVGELAYYIFNGSPRPVKEVSIVAALGLVAGICGKAFCIPQSGLNIYLVLVAKSAVGKEAMHSGIANIMGYVREGIPEAMNFVDFTDYASGPALVKAVAANQSFVNVSGEWGRKLRRLGMEDGRDGPMQQLRTTMTNLYQKSGPKSIVGGISYSDKEKNITSVSGVAYSMIGETTPSTFYDSLTETMMEDGFLSRFTIIEYTGSRPEFNDKAVKAPSAMLLEAMCSMIQRAIDLNEKFATVDVGRSSGAAELLDAFNLECDRNINSSDDEGFRQMWNRAHLKACRIAALLAVADNNVFPTIEKHHAEWALLLIRKDIGVMSRRISSGDVGVGDAPRERKLLSLIGDFLQHGAPPSYGVPEKMRAAAVVPRKYLQMCTQRSGSFTTHRSGQIVALDQSIRSLIDSGYIVEMDKTKAVKEFDFHGKCYRIITIPRNTQEERDARRARQD
jgi:hypothetical protein